MAMKTILYNFQQCEVETYDFLRRQEHFNRRPKHTEQMWELLRQFGLAITKYQRARDDCDNLWYSKRPEQWTIESYPGTADFHELRRRGVRRDQAQEEAQQLYETLRRLREEK